MQYIHCNRFTNPIRHNQIISSRSTMSPSPPALPTSTPISRVPKNVLKTIFKYISDDARPNFSAEAAYLECTIPNQTSRYLFTHVCRCWRTEAKSYPQLWNYVCIGSFSTDQTMEYLERSKQIALDVEVYCTVETVSEVQRQLELLLPHAYRVRNLLVKIVSSTSFDILLPPIESLRNIVSLQILSFPFGAVLSAHSNPHTPNQPLSLRALQLCCAIPSADLLPNFSSVTDLSLDWSDHEACPTWFEFVSLIQASPNLARLKISNYELSRDDVPQNDGDAIPIPSLTTLDLSLTTESCSCFLQAFELSLVAQINITCTNYDTTSPIIVPFHLSNATPCTSLQVSYTPESIAFTSLFTVFDAPQQIKITLCVLNMKGGLAARIARMKRIVDRWVRSELFSGVRYVLRSPILLPEDGWDDAMDPLSLYN